MIEISKTGYLIWKCHSSDPTLASITTIDSSSFVLFEFHAWSEHFGWPTAQFLPIALIAPIARSRWQHSYSIHTTYAIESCLCSWPIMSFVHLPIFPSFHFFLSFHLSICPSTRLHTCPLAHLTFVRLPIVFFVDRITRCDTSQQRFQGK